MTSLNLYSTKKVISCFCFWGLVFCLLSPVAASDDELSAAFAQKNTISAKQEVEKFKKKKKKKKPPQPKQYYLERYDNGNLLAQYTSSIKINEDTTFPLNDDVDLEMSNSVTALLPNTRSHLIACGFCYHSDEIKTTPIKTSLGFEGININPDNTVDWISYVGGGAALPVNAGYYSRVSPGGHGTPLYGGHSEPYFISDINALWTQNYTSVLKFLVPSPIFQGNQDIYMTGIEIFGSFDMCSAYHIGGNNRYNCIGELTQFRQQHQQGQQSISQAVRNLLQGRFQGGADSRAFVLIYHASLPYTCSADYNATNNDDSPQLAWNGNQFNVTTEEHPIIANDILSQYTAVNEAPNMLYCHIHSLTGRQLIYSESYFQYQE